MWAPLAVLKASSAALALDEKVRQVGVQTFRFRLSVQTFRFRLANNKREKAPKLHSLGAFLGVGYQ